MSRRGTERVYALGCAQLRSKTLAPRQTPSWNSRAGVRSALQSPCLPRAARIPRHRGVTPGLSRPSRGCFYEAAGVRRTRSRAGRPRMGLVRSGASRLAGRNPNCLPRALHFSIVYGGAVVRWLLEWLVREDSLGASVLRHLFSISFILRAIRLFFRCGCTAECENNYWNKK